MPKFTIPAPDKKTQVTFRTPDIFRVVLPADFIQLNKWRISNIHKTVLDNMWASNSRHFMDHRTPVAKVLAQAKKYGEYVLACVNTNNQQILFIGENNRENIKKLHACATTSEYMTISWYWSNTLEDLFSIVPNNLENNADFKVSDLQNRGITVTCESKAPKAELIKDYIKVKSQDSGWHVRFKWCGGGKSITIDNKAYTVPTAIGRFYNSKGSLDELITAANEKKDDPGIFCCFFSLRTQDTRTAYAEISAIAVTTHPVNPAI